jgi:hypothetical protein
VTQFLDQRLDFGFIPAAGGEGGQCLFGVILAPVEAAVDSINVETRQ